MLTRFYNTEYRHVATKRIPVTRSLSSLPAALFVIFVVTALSACSANQTYSSANSASVKQRGTVVAVQRTYLKPETLRPSVGVSVGSGGYRGVYGGVDVGNVVRVIKDANLPRFEQRIIVRTTNGETVSITQISRERFKRGDPVNLVLLNNGEARVIRASQASLSTTNP